MNEQDQFWHEPAAALLMRTASSPQGLDSAEAARRLAKDGPNRYRERLRLGLAKKIGRRLIEPLVAILLVAAMISFFAGDRASFVLITIVIALSILLDVVQEQRAESAAEALRRSVAVKCDVMRGGALHALPVTEVVRGDVIALRAGDLVPADGILLDSRNLHVNEALMTGESFPAEKMPGDCQAVAPADAFNALFAGTAVVAGEGTMLVLETGEATRFGEIAATITSAETPSAFERGLHRLGLLILRMTVFLVLFVLLMNVAFGHRLLDAFLFSVALAVGLTPELLPMVTTVTLSRGALRMARKQVIVKRLAAIHDFGAMDVLCTDKTGTLTEARIELVDHLGCDGTSRANVALLAGVNSAFSSGIRSPLDEAILARCGNSHSVWRKLDEVPFDFGRRFVSVLAEGPAGPRLLVKGAPQSVLSRCTHYEADDGKVRVLDEGERARLARFEDQRAEQGYRLLAVAWKGVGADCCMIGENEERELTLSGFCVFLDPPKATAADAAARLAALGVRIKVISGDHDGVVRHVAGVLRISDGPVLTGSEIETLTDSALVARVEEVDLFARVTPDQKTRIIRALQARGHTVGFIGDGVNDAPAIRAAEVGVSVEGATDVARASADMILLAPDLGVLADGVEEGRRTFANILKYVRMGTSSNFGNMLSMALASLVLPFLPLLPIQILLNNLLYDLSEIGIPFDAVDPVELASPRQWDMSGVLRFALVMGPLSSAFDLATFAVLLHGFDAGPELFRTAWFVESTATQILVIFVIRTRAFAFASWAHPALTLSSLVALAVALAIVASPWRTAFGFTTLGGAIVASIIVIVLGYLVAAEVAKRFAMSSPYSRGPGG